MQSSVKRVEGTIKQQQQQTQLFHYAFLLFAPRDLRLGGMKQSGKRFESDGEEIGERGLSKHSGDIPKTSSNLGSSNLKLMDSKVPV